MNKISRAVVMFCSILLGFGTVIVNLRVVVTPSHIAKAISPPGGAYTPVTPDRICDTRNGTNCTLGAVGPSKILTVTLPNGSVPSSANAIVVNVTVTSPQQAGFLTVYPTQSGSNTPPNTSSLNFSAGQTVANLVTVEIGLNNSISIANESAGTTQIIVDLEGYYLSMGATSGGSGHFYPLSPYRAVDTRNGSPNYYAGQTLVAGKPEVFKIGGSGGVPGSGVMALVLNVTVTDTTANGGFLTIWQGGSVPLPNASNVNWSAGQTVANRVTVPTLNGSVEVEAQNSNADVIIDINGYYSDATGSSSAGALFNPINPPVRILDTRNTQPIGPNSFISVPVDGAGNGAIPSSNSPNPPVSLVSNVTETQATIPAGGFFTVFPDTASAPPNTSDLNFASGENVPNMAITVIGSGGGIKIYNFGGTSDAIVDAEGYFVAANPSANDISISLANPGPVNVGSTTTLNISDFNQGAPVGSVNVNPAPNSSDCGTLGSANPVTLSNGTASETYTAPNTVGPCTLIVSDSLGSQASVTLNQVSPVTISFNNGNYFQTGANSSLGSQNIPITVTNPLGNVSGTVNIQSPVSNPSGACGTLASQSITVTNGSGTIAYTPSNVAGICELSLSLNGQSNVTTLGIITQALTSSTGTYVVNVSAQNSKLTADGTSSDTVTVTVTDSNNIPVPSDPVALSAQNGCVTFQGGSGITNVSGTVRFTVYSTSTLGSCTINAEEGLSGSQGGTAIQLVAPDSVTVSPGAVAIPADGTTTIPVKVAVSNVNGADPFDQVTITTSCGTIANNTEVTDQFGLATFLLTSGTTPSVCTITANEARTNAAGSSQVALTSTSNNAGKLNQITFSYSNSSGSTSNPEVPSDGSSLITVTVTVSSPGGSGVANDPISVTPVTSSANICTLSNQTGTTSTNGSFSFTVTGGAPGACRFLVQEANTGSLGTGSVTVYLVYKVELTVNGVPSSLPLVLLSSFLAGQQVGVAIFDNLNNPVAGVPVNLGLISPNTPNYSQNVCGKFVTSSSGVTNSNGIFEATYNPGGVGFCVLLATGGPAGVSPNPLGLQKFLMVQTQNEAGSSGNTKPQVKIASSPSVILNNSNATTNIYLRIADSNGIVVANDPVIFLNPALLPPAFGGKPTCGGVPLSDQFTPLGIESNIAPAVTDSSGSVNLPYTSSSYSGFCTGIVLDAFYGQLTFFEVTQASTVPPVSQVSYSANPAEITPGTGATSIDVTISGTGGSTAGDQISIQSESGICSGANNVSLAFGYAANMGGNSGVVMNYTPISGVVGFCLIELKDSYSGSVNTLVITQIASPTTSTQDVVATNLSSTGGLTVTVTDSLSNPVIGDGVLAYVNGCPNATISPSSLVAVTNSNGVATFTLGGTIGGCTVNVVEEITGATATVSVPTNVSY